MTKSSTGKTAASKAAASEEIKKTAAKVSKQLPVTAAVAKALESAPVPVPVVVPVEKAVAAVKKAAAPAKKADKADKTEKAAAEAKEKPKKPKLVRDSFTMPEAEYAVLTDLKKACLKDGVEVKKSELLRVGVALLRRLDTAGIKEVLAGLPSLKAGRPKKTK